MSREKYGGQIQDKAMVGVWRGGRQRLILLLAKKVHQKNMLKKHIMTIKLPF